MRRKRSEAKIFANEIVMQLGEALGAKTAPTQETGSTREEPKRQQVPTDKKILSTGRDKKGRQKIPAAEFFKLLGADE